MSRCIAILAFIFATVSTIAAPVPRVDEKPGGIVILNDAVPLFEAEYSNNCLTMLSYKGKKQFRIDGFSNAVSLHGSSRMIATDRKRMCIWTIENMANRIRRFDLTGKETLAIPIVNGNAIAIDPETGNAWALTGPNLGEGQLHVFDPKGKEIAAYEVFGRDIVYDPFAKAFWIANRKLTKIEAATAKEIFSINITAHCASSLDINSKTGECWVALCKDPNDANSTNKLRKFDGTGKELLTVERGDVIVYRVSVDSTIGSVWLSNFGKSVERISTGGRSEFVHDVDALAIQADPVGEIIWVVTPTETQKLSAKGEVLAREKHAAKIRHAWIAAIE